VGGELKLQTFYKNRKRPGQKLREKTEGKIGVGREEMGERKKKSGKKRVEGGGNPRRGVREKRKWGGDGGEKK